MAEVKREKNRPNWSGVLIGVLVLSLVAYVMLDTILTDSGTGLSERWGLEISGEAPIAPDRFVFSETLQIRACVNEAVDGEVCLFAMGRDGKFLGDGHRLQTAQGGCWEGSVRASTFSVSSYGPLWAVVIGGVEGCKRVEYQALMSRVQDTEQPLAALGKAIDESSWSWGARRIYVHDKLP